MAQKRIIAQILIFWGVGGWWVYGVASGYHLVLLTQQSSVWRWVLELVWGFGQICEIM